MSLQKLSSLNETLESRAVRAFETTTGAVHGAEQASARLVGRLPVVGALAARVAAATEPLRVRRHELAGQAVRAPYASSARLLDAVAARTARSDSGPIVITSA